MSYRLEYQLVNNPLPEPYILCISDNMQDILAELDQHVDVFHKLADRDCVNCQIFSQKELVWSKSFTPYDPNVDAMESIANSLNQMAYDSGANTQQIKDALIQSARIIAKGLNSVYDV